MYKNWWFEIVGENDELCGEEFFVYETDRKKAWDTARIYFPFEELVCHGAFDDEFADNLGLDTY